MFGVLGGRIDHGLCNIMVCAKHPGAVRLIDEASVIVALGAGRRFDGAASPGDIVTLIALGEEARCATSGSGIPCGTNRWRAGAGD